jgi:hypothetical protein
MTESFMCRFGAISSLLCPNVDVLKLIYVMFTISMEERDRCYSLILSRTSREAAKGLIAFTSEIDCDQTAMGLLPLTSAVLLIAK